MKRQMVLFLAVGLLLACSACGKNEETVQTETPPSSVSQQVEPAPESEPAAGSEAPAPEPLPAEDEKTQEDSPEIPAAGTVPEEQEKENPADDPQPDSPRESAVSVDVDLTTLSSTMVYAEVFNMMMSPDDYIGKIIRMTGTFTARQDPQTALVSCGVIVQDATACCAQGFDIIMPENAVYPQDYPPSESEVTVVGELQVDPAVWEYGIVFLRLENVTFE